MQRCRGGACLGGPLSLAGGEVGGVHRARARRAWPTRAANSQGSVGRPPVPLLPALHLHHREAPREAPKTEWKRPPLLCETGQAGESAEHGGAEPDSPAVALPSASPRASCYRCAAWDLGDSPPGKLRGRGRRTCARHKRATQARGPKREPSDWEGGDTAGEAASPRHRRR